MSNYYTNYDYLLKFIIIGDATVGKSNLLFRYYKGIFQSDYQLTIGVDFSAKNVKIRNKTYKIQIWDTAGHENFKSITRGYYTNSACVLVVYDISNRDSFNNVNNWINECKNLSSKSILLVLVGNKSDLEERRQVNVEDGQELADKNGMLFYETSAKVGTNVNTVFYDSVDKIAKNIDEGYYDLKDVSCGIKIAINNNAKNNNNEKIRINNKRKKKRFIC